VALDVQQYPEQLGYLQVVGVLYIHNVEVCMDQNAVESAHNEAAVLHQQNSARPTVTKSESNSIIIVKSCQA